MKKLLCISLFLPLLLVAGLNVNKVSNTLVHLESVRANEVLKFFNANEKIKLNNGLKFTSLEKANIVLFPKKNTNKISIVDSYKKLQENKKSIGAIYLKKGRTEIIFINERLKDNGLRLPNSYNKHLLSECQINPVCLLSDMK